MKEEGNRQPKNQDLEKYRLSSYWSHHFLKEINVKLESALTPKDQDVSKNNET